MKTYVMQSNFTAGEISPRLMGRVDVARYANAVKSATNCKVIVQGGLQRRDGTRYVADAKYPGKKVRLVPWVFSANESYILEVGDKYIRFFQNGQQVMDAAGTTPLEVTTVIEEAMLEELSYAQSSDTMIFAHQLMKPQLLKRNSQTNWTIGDVKFTVLPFDELKDSPSGYMKPEFQGPIGKSISLVLTNDGAGAAYTGTGFDGYKVGDYVRINSGTVRITAITDKAHAQGEIRSLMYSADAASSEDWTLEQACWNDTDGWPGTVAFHQQRLVLAGSARFPQHIWGSMTGDYFNFELGLPDDNAYAFQLASDQVNRIEHLYSMNSLIALTGAGEFVITGVNNLIAPTSIQVKVPSNFGANAVRPIRVGTQLMYVHRADRKVMAMEYDSDSSTPYTINDMTLLAEHMTKDGVTDITWQAEPEGLIHLVTKTGELLTITNNKESSVVAWTRNQTDGQFKATATIPRGTGNDDTYFVVQRTINGVAKTFIEKFQTGLNVDSALHGEVIAPNPGLDEWTNLDHLEGKEVDVVADGIPQPRVTVQNGKVKLQRKVMKVEIGLPFITKIVTLSPELQTPMGSAQGTRSTTVEMKMRFLETTGCRINGDIIPFNTYGKNRLNQPPTIFTGDKTWQAVGWANHEITIEQWQPLPFHLLALIRTMALN